MRNEILYMIQRYQNRVRGLEQSIAEAEHETDRMMLIARKGAYELDMIPDLKRLLEKLPEPKQAKIIMRFDGDDDEYEYGTYSFTTPQERNYVNGLALQIRREHGCQVEVREV